jgi:hypothetical protein
MLFLLTNLDLSQAEGVTGPAPVAAERSNPMFGLSAERPMFSWLLSHLGPPPPPPRRHFSKSWDPDPQHWIGSRLPQLGLSAASPDGAASPDSAESRDTQVRHDPSGT